MVKLAYHWLGQVPYKEALDLQLQLRQAVLSGMHPGALLLLTHPPTVTIGRHGNPNNLLLDPEALRQRGASVHHIDRGGDVTFHGPGQLVGYPVLSLHALKMGVQRYAQSLATVLQQVLAQWDIKTQWDALTPGLWVDNNKIAALGIHIHRGVTTHGFALNVTTDLSWFDTIVPCGLMNRGVTSMAQILGARCPSLIELCDCIHREFQAVFGIQIEYSQDSAVSDFVPKEGNA
jgi:lipoyl(octanoyl) transferase